MRFLLLLLLVIPLAFAAWQTTAAVAIMASAGFLGLIYMIAMGFGINELQIVAKEEFFQLLALCVMVALLLGSDGLLNSIVTNPIFSDGTATNLTDAALKSIDASIIEMDAVFSSISGYDEAAAIEGSKASQCSLLGMGYSVSGCGGYSMLATPLSMAGGIIGFAIGELQTMKRLIIISEQFALPFLLPLGILLRTFKLTRGAGGLLIALGISLYIMLPLGVVFNDMLAATFLSPPGGAADAALSAPYKVAATSVDLDCNPGDTGTDNEDDAIAGYNAMRANLRAWLYGILIKATLGPVIGLLMMSTSIKAISSLAGAEVDVSAISRFV